MGGRTKREFLAKDGRWVIYWQSLGDPAEEDKEHEADHTPELILAMEALTEKQRFVLELRYGLRGWPAMTVREIARLMGISHQCVSRLEHRAMVRLRKGVPESPIDVWGKR